MYIKVICVGKLKEHFYKDAVKEFAKRLSRYAEMEILEVADEPAPEQLSPAQKEQVKVAEGRRILGHIGPQEQVIAMEIRGEMLSSPQLAAAMDRWMGDGKSRFCFVIGGSLGLSEEVLERANFSLSFGSPTFSHQLFRIMLLEQLYRAFKILGGEPYHK